MTHTKTPIDTIYGTRINGKFGHCDVTSNHQEHVNAAVKMIATHAELVAALESAYETIGKLAATLRIDGRNESATLGHMQQQSIGTALLKARAQ